MKLNNEFAAAITLYNPDSSIIKKVEDYSNIFERVFLYDNSENVNIEIVGQLRRIPNVLILGSNGNMGLPIAFNTIIEHPLAASVDYLCTLDQDSMFSNENIEELMKYINSCCNSYKLGIVGPFVDYGYNKNDNQQGFKVKPWVITSGAFVNLNVIRKENLRYDINYFIDKFEIDLCEQITRKGYIVGMFYGSVLYQQLGEYSGHKHPNHSPIRHYYLFRNRLYFNKKFYVQPKRFVWTFLQSTRHIVLILLYENNKIQKIKSFGWALLDYFNGNLGKTSRCQND